MKLSCLALGFAFLAGCAPRAVGDAALSPQWPAFMHTMEAVTQDPAREPRHPARNRQLLIDSHGAKMNALFFLAAGAGPHPTMLLLHGLPGNERNLDLAQAVRRAGWNVLTFTYRGAWGSDGDFSIAHSIEDTAAAMAFLRSPEAIRTYGIDIDRLVVAGHSMGGLAAARQAAAEGPGDPPLAGVVLIDPWDAGADGERAASGGPAARRALEAGFDDLGRALHGAGPASLADELEAHRRDWRLAPLIPRLALHPVLLVDAREGEGPRLRGFAADLKRAGGERVTVEEMDTDHAFADHRIALAVSVVRWLQKGMEAGPGSR